MKARQTRPLQERPSASGSPGDEAGVPGDVGGKKLGGKQAKQVGRLGRENDSDGE